LVCRIIGAASLRHRSARLAYCYCTNCKSASNGGAYRLPHLYSPIAVRVAARSCPPYGRVAFHRWFCDQSFLIQVNNSGYRISFDFFLFMSHRLCGIESGARAVIDDPLASSFPSLFLRRPPV
jgi:hypothetical protein